VVLIRKTPVPPGHVVLNALHVRGTGAASDICVGARPSGDLREVTELRNTA